MSLETFFDKIFVINLDRREDRWEACKQEMARFGVLSYTRFSGYDHPTEGHAGCTRSHRMLLRQVVEGPWDRILVLEDDFKIITVRDLLEGGFTPESPVMRTFLMAPGRGFQARFDAMIKMVPEDWDVVYIGAGYGEPPIARVNRHIIRCGFMQTTGSYGITKRFAKIWSDTVDERVGGLDHHPGPIDNVFGWFARENKFYVFQPRLMYQRLSRSDITGKDEKYLFSMTDPVHENMV